MATAAFVPVRISRVAPNFTGEMAHFRAGDAGLSRVRSGPCEVVRTTHEIDGSVSGLAAFALQVAGPIQVEQGGARTRTPAGSSVLYVTDEPYTLTFPDESDLFILQAPFEMFGLRAGDLRRARVRSIPTLGDSDLRIYARMLRQHFTSSPDATAARTTRIGLELISRSLRRRLSLPTAPRSHETLLLALRSHVAEHLDDAGLDVNSLARSEGVSPRTVHNAFELDGTTPARYIRRMRIARAERLLRSTNLRIADIAAVAGFADHSTMTRAFRRDIGVTPSEIRHARDTD